MKKRRVQHVRGKVKLLALLVGVFLGCHVSLRAQDAIQVDLKLSRVPLDEVFKKVEQLTDYVFIYNSEDVQIVPRVSLDVKQARIQDILDRCLENTSLSYEFKKNVIIIRKRVLKQQDPVIRIFGKVTDKKKEPLPGVTVKVKGMPLGVATDLDGAYSISVPGRTERLVLQFSFVGMTPR